MISGGLIEIEICYHKAVLYDSIFSQNFKVMRAAVILFFSFLKH